MRRTRKERENVKKLLSEINYNLSKIVNLLEHLVRMTAKSSERPLAWLAKENCPEAEQLRAEDPERYDYAMKILKLFFS